MELLIEKWVLELWLVVVSFLIFCVDVEKMTLGLSYDFLLTSSRIADDGNVSRLLGNLRLLRPGGAC